MAETWNSPVRPRRGWAAALLSLWMPGLGQLYSGRLRRALALALGWLLLLFALNLAGLPKTFTGLVVWCALGLLVLIWIAWDAFRLARGAGAYSLSPFNRWYLYVVLGFAYAYAARRGLDFLPIRTFQVPSGAMEPTIQPGDHLVADLWAWHGRSPARRDVVLFASPEDPRQVVIKRVVAVAGDQVEIRNKILVLDGQPVADDRGMHGTDFLAGDTALIAQRDNLAPERVPPGSVFILGDNRDNSYDSRFYGPVPLSLLRGQPLYLYWARDRSRIGSRIR